MKKKNKTYRWLLMLAIVPILLEACVESEDFSQCPNLKDKIQFTLSLPEQTRVTAKTRANVTTPRIDYSIVNNFHLILTEGKTIKQIYYFEGTAITPNNGNITMIEPSLPMKPKEDGSDCKRVITITGTSGEFKNIDCAYIVANYGENPTKPISMATVSTIDDVIKLQQTTNDGQPGNGKDCIMFGSTSQLVNGTISLKRTIAMLSVKIKGDQLKKGVRITPTKISLHNVPKACYIGCDNKIENKNEAQAIGQIEEGLKEREGWGTLSSSGDGTKTVIGGHDNELGTIPLFMFENLQGDGEVYQGGSSHDQQVYKLPKSFTGDPKQPELLQKYLDETKMHSYILIEADYDYQDPSNPEKEIRGTIAYRFLLGNNIINSFDVERNNYYQITLDLKNGGGALEDGKEDKDGNLLINNTDLSWRVDMFITDFGFTKEKYNFDCHAEVGIMDIVGTGWKITEAKSGTTNMAGQSWILFSTSHAGTVGWSEPTDLLEIGVGDIISYYIKPIQVDDFDKGPKRTMTLTLKNTNTGAQQIVTFIQWYPVKVPVTLGGKQFNVYMERFEEESNLAWGCNGTNLNNMVTVYYKEGYGHSQKHYNFGDFTTLSDYSAGNAYFIWNQEGYGTSWECKRNKDMAAATYCLNKSWRADQNGSGNDEYYYTLPSASIFKELIRYSNSSNDGNFERLRENSDYWTSTVYEESPKATSYWDGSSKGIKSTENRNDRKRVRSIFIRSTQMERDLFNH